jgi:hypothetical protein
LIQSWRSLFVLSGLRGGGCSSVSQQADRPTTFAREDTERRSEAVFAELVRRHVDLIYSAALRMVCDSHGAKDVTPGSFVQ